MRKTGTWCLCSYFLPADRHPCGATQGHLASTFRSAVTHQLQFRFLHFIKDYRLLYFQLATLFDSMFRPPNELLRLFFLTCLDGT